MVGSRTSSGFQVPSRCPIYKAKLNTRGQAVDGELHLLQSTWGNNSLAGTAGMRDPAG